MITKSKSRAIHPALSKPYHDTPDLTRPNLTSPGLTLPRRMSMSLWILYHR